MTKRTTAKPAKTGSATSKVARTKAGAVKKAEERRRTDRCRARGPHTPDRHQAGEDDRHAQG